MVGVGSAERHRVLQSAGGKTGEGVAEVRSTHGRTPSIRIPILRVSQQVPHLSVNESDPDGKLPAIALPSQPAREEYLHLVAIVLLEPSDSFVEYTAGLHERLADHRGKAIDQHAGDECGKDRDSIVVEGANPRGEGIVVEPGRIRRGRVDEEVTQRSRGIAKRHLVLLHAGSNELARLRLGQ